ncbi:DUF4164 domain-containing protein [Bartonella sp. HY329]|uniref:DUF4164 domain-containing protein n=1 Tax=unclassified Bartonella TaxID=2645622 RepID=UPI0021C908B9|nr:MULTISPECIES: DUF4164 domain-containing protein [unclassified Bartonella]UXM95540.1 DUF4164 domain-containing protein [Bartonella sp. HY329]UXN09865.1 DUF4164 domain-containing protein [Bartonella sp. HY328]
MAVNTSLEQALEHMSRALNMLENAVEARIEAQSDVQEFEEEVQRLNADRSRLAQELDKAESRGERLEQANKDVSRRLITAMETIRAVIER